MPRPAAWPLADRRTAFDAVRARLLASPPRVQVLTGPAGIGKTTAADGLAERLVRARRRVVRIVGLAELTPIALGALAPFLSGEPGEVDGELRRFFARVGRPAGSAVLLVDDGPLLDDVSAAAVYQLVRVFGVPALMTARDGMRWPDPLDRLDREGLVDRTAVAPLSHAETAAVLERRLGERISPDTVNELRERTGGNALFLRRLVEQAERAGGIRPGAHGITVDASTVPPQIDAVIAQGLDGLGPEARADVDVLSFAGPLPIGALRAAAELQSAGLALLDGTVARLAHPLIAETMRARLDEAGSRTAMLTAAAALRGSGDHASRQRALRLELEAGQRVAPEELAAAAAAARGASDHAEAVRLAQRAIDDGHPTAAPWWDLAAALSALGRLDEADTAFAEGWRRAADPGERLTGASLHGEHLAYRRLDLPAAVARVEATLAELPPGLRPLLEAEARIWRTIAGATPSGAATGLPLPALAPAAASVRAAMASVLSDSMRGDRSGARQSADVIATALREFGAVDPLASSMLHLERFFDELGDARGDAAWEVVETQRSGAVSDAAGIWSYTLGVFCYYDGRLAEGIALAELAVEQLRWRDLSGLLGAAIALRALFAALLGSADGRAALLAELTAAQRAEPRAAMLLAEGDAWAALARGETDTAVGIVTGAGAGAVAAGYGLVGALTLALGIRAGGASSVAGPLQDAVRDSGGHNVLIRALRDLAVAVTERDAAAGIDAAAIVARAGMRATAADALAQLLPSARPETRRRGRLLLDRVRQGVDAPLLRAPSLAEPAPTEREMQLAGLVAERLTNQEIAVRLGISVRTVENHLSRLYAKTGLRSRAELRHWVATVST